MPASNPPALAPLVEKLQLRSAFAADEITALMNLPVRSKTLKAGAYLVREGDIPEGCWILLAGSASRHRTTRGGYRQILAIHLQGELLGLNYGLLTVADHSVQTLSHSTVGVIPHQAVLDLTAAFPNISRALWLETLVEASVAREWIVNVGQRDARQRIAHLLCELAFRQRAGDMPPELTVHLPLTQEQIGDATGMTSVHVNRTVKGLRAAGLISTEWHSVKILDWEGLQYAGDFKGDYLHLPDLPGAELRRDLSAP